MTRHEAIILRRGRMRLSRAVRLACIPCGRVPVRGEATSEGAIGMHREEGAALVETAVSMGVFLAVLFGLIAFSYALYSYNYVSDAARVATRYAAVRGFNSCTIEPTFPNCNLDTSAPLQTYIRQSTAYPGINMNNMTLTATWLMRGVDASGNTSWVACTDTICNSQGHAVNVVVSYQFPLNIPFWANTNLTVHSTSQMVINE